jgi:type III secretion protein S
MYSQHLLELSYQALLLILILSGPPVLISMALGLVVAIFQAATQIQEQTLSFVVKLVAVFLVLMLMGNWLGAAIYQYAATIFEGFWKWGD